MLFRSILNKLSKFRFHSTSVSSNDLTKVSCTKGVKKITMCDAKTRNSLSIAMMQNLIDNICDDWSNKKLRVILLSGEGPIFSAGHNLKELTEEAGRESQQKVFDLASTLMTSIIECPVPVVAVVDGYAAAAGCQLVAQCDLAVCTKDSKFSTPGVNLGIFCSTPGVALARSVPKATALKMLLTGVPIFADEALQAGLVSHVCDKAEMDATVDALCSDVILKSRSVIELGKRGYYKQINESVMGAYTMAGKLMVKNLNIPDGVEGIRSFVEKRKPNWSH